MATMTGRCLCGAVRYEVTGPLRDVLICHCMECRRWNDHASASSAARKQGLVLLESQGLRWIDSPNSDAGARRGFCGECGSSLFWDPPRRETISISAGTLDDDLDDFVDLEDRSVELRPLEGFVVPKGVVHRTRAPLRSVVLMAETAAIVPTGDA